MTRRTATSHRPGTTATTRTVTSYRPGTYVINYDHRLDGPGHIGVYPNDDNDHLITLWFDDGHRHRLDGPDCTMSGGSLQWRSGRIHVSGDDS